MLFYFKVSSKDNKTLKKFLLFLSKLKALPMTIKYSSKQKKRKFITLLKSPHVNKTAQEQFEFKYYSKSIFVDVLKPSTFFQIIKKVKNFSFPGLKLEIKVLLSVTKKTKNFLKIVNPDNLVLSQNFLTVNKKFQQKYVQFFDCYGELCLKNMYYSKQLSV